jgi:hypothetical protein
MSTLAKKCRMKAEAEGFSALMNNTKWRELCLGFAAFENKPAWRSRDLLTGYVSAWDTEWFHHVGPDYCSIEWLEIEARQNPPSAIRELLERVGAPFEEASSFRIFGYKR